MFAIMAPQRGVTVATTDFPLYTIQPVGDSHLLVAGGGGQAKTGVPNAVVCLFWVFTIYVIAT